MIYTASLSIPAKKVLPKQVMQSTIKKISSNMPLAPETTGMDVVILSPKDFVGPNSALLDKAIASAHPDICIIYLYQKDNEADLVQTPYTRKYKRGKETAVIRESIEEFVGQHKILSGGKQVSSADFTTPDSDDIPDLGTPEEIPNKVEVKSSWEPQMLNRDEVQLEEPTKENDSTGPEEVEPSVDIDLPPIDIESVQQEEKPLDTDVHSSDPLNPLPTENVVAPEPATKTVEEYLSRINSYEDWSIFKENLRRDSIVKRLIEENSEYVGLINMLDVLDKRIETVWRDTALSPDMKFEKIKEIGLERSVVKATENSINVEKVISIISTIVLAAKRTVDEKVKSIDASVYKLVTDKKAITDTSYIDKAIEERTKVQLDLLALSRGIVDLYKSIDDLITDEIADLDRKLPSSNAFINNMVKPIGTQIFTPQNTAALVNKLTRALQENRIVASQLEESVNAVIETLFTLCEADEKVIRWQQNMINMLKANHVEDVIIVNSLLKNCLRLYTGSDNSGRSATAIVHSGVLSRAHNTLLIDLTGHAKFKDYGITPMSLDDFMTSRVEEHFLCVEAPTVPSPDELQEIVTSLKSRLNYYQYVNVIVPPSQPEILDQLSVDAKAVFYITNCSSTSLSEMKEVIKNHKTSNIAREVVMIDTPVSPLMIADNLGVDSTMTKLVTLPNIPMIRSCAIKHDRPYEYSDVARIFEEAFR